MVKFYFVTISKYGDAIGSNLLRTLKRKTQNVDFYGVGGPKMGLNKIIEYEKLHDNMYLSDDETKFAAKDYAVVSEIMRLKPEVVITIGNWDFCKNIHKKINCSGHCGKVILIHYVAPSVFYKGDRFIKEMSEQIDFLVSVYPQEVNCANRYKLPCTYAGHPMMEIRCSHTNCIEFMKRIKYKAPMKVFAALLETNLSDVKRILPDLLDVGKYIQSQNSDAIFLLLSSGKILSYIEDMVHKTQSKAIVLDEEYDFDNVASVAKVAIATSEKATFKFSLADIPHVVAYKEPSLERLKFGSSRHFHFLNLINLILEKNVIPVQFNYNYSVKNIKKTLVELLDEGDLYKNQLKAFQDLKYLLKNGKKASSENAADSILDFVRGLMCVNGSCIYL